MTEPTPTFDSLALASGYVTEAQLDEARGVQKKVAEAGLETSLEEILLKKGFLTRQQLAALNSHLGKGVKTAIEGYAILEKIAQGGMGAVYKAKQTSMDRIVAIKVLLPKFAKEHDAVERFLREAKSVAHLSHPNIVSGIDAGVSNGIYYYVMEFLDGEPMNKLVQSRGPLPLKEAAGIVRQVASALEHAHKQGIVHRDIKPSNIILLKDGTAKLADLGLARLASGEDIFVTQTGAVVGTPAYLSPEQARGDKQIDIRSDLYSLGITFFEFLTGKPPFTGDQALTVMSMHATKDVPVDALPKDAGAVIARLCARDRNRRYQTPTALVQDLDTLLAGGVLRPTPPPPERKGTVQAPAAPARPNNMLALVAAAAVFVLGGIALVIVLTRRDDPAPQAEQPVVKETPRPEERPIPEDLSLSDAERRAVRDYNMALEFEEKNPERLEETIELYRASLAADEDANIHKLAKKKIEDLIARLAEKLKSHEEQVDRDIREHEAGGGYGKAHERASAAVHLFADPEWKKKMKDRAEAVLLRAKAAHAALLKEVQSLDPDRAIAKLESVHFGLAEIDDDLAKRREQIAQARDERLTAADKNRRADEETVGETMPQVIQLLRSRDASGAVKLVEQLLARLHGEELKKPARLWRDWLGATEAFLKTAKENMEHLRAGEKVLFELRVPGAKPEKVEGRVKAGTGEAVLVETPKERTVALRDLTVASLATLAERTVKPLPDPRGPALLAVFEGELPTAERFMDGVVRARLEVPPRLEEDMRVLRENEERRRSDEERAAKRDQEAESLLAEAEKAFSAKKVDQGMARLEKLLADFAGTPFLQKNESRIKKLQALIPREVVIYASDARDLPREWRLVDDPQAGGGKVLLSQANRSFPNPENSPHVDFKFVAVKDVKYRLWVHLKCGARRANQNAILVQLSDAQFERGARPFAPIGTLEALVCQFWMGDRTPERGWSGHDQYREPNRDVDELLFTFKTSGEKTIRILVYEDGTAFDQIVISADKYLHESPKIEVVTRPKK